MYKCAPFVSSAAEILRRLHGASFTFAKPSSITEEVKMEGSRRSELIDKSFVSYTQLGSNKRV